MEVTVTVNGSAESADVEPRTLLVQFIRDNAALTGTNIGCDTSSCGACTVLLNGESVKSCTVLAVQADGQEVTTIEGLADPDGTLHPMQQAFHECHALQCGYCTPGMVMASVSLLDEVPDPTEAQVREGLEGNLCRCTGYHNIVKAVLQAADGGKPMIPAVFDYVRVDSADGAIAALAEHGDEAKLLAGGHSLLPLMKFRLATPGVLVDIGRITDLSYVRDDGDQVAIGALTRHRDVEIDPLVGSQVPLLAAATSQVGDPQVRHRGTIGGSVAHGDPASDIPSVLLALRATLVARGPDGTREIAVDDFFTGFLETALAEGELLTEIRVPKVPDAGWSFQKFNRRAQDWAIVGASVVVNADTAGVGLVNMASTPVRAGAVETAVAAGASAADAAESAADGLNPPADLNASTEFREHLARVLVRRGLEEAGR